MSEESTESSSPPAAQRNVVGGFKEMGAAEKLIALGAAGFLLAFIVKSEFTWKSLFKFGSDRYVYGWWMTLGFLGSVGVLTLVITKLLDIKLVDAKLWPKLLLLGAAIPAVGWIIDSLQNFWLLVMIVSTAVLGFAASRLIAKD